MVFAYYLYFLVYSVIGWIYEVLLEIFVFGNGFVNRGILFGPYCPVYGVGTLVFLFCVYPLVKNKDKKTRLLLIPVVFLACMTIATLIELATSYICEFFLGTWPWEYFDYSFNFEGRIALSPSVRFGLGGCLFLYVIQPLLEKLTNKLGEKKVKTIAIVLFVIFVIDFIVTVFSNILG